MTQFTPLKEFTATDETGKVLGVYTPGLTYAVRPGNQKLANLVQQWLAEGKVRLGAAASTGGQVAGQG